MDFYFRIFFLFLLSFFAFLFFSDFVVGYFIFKIMMLSKRNGGFSYIIFQYVVGGLYRGST